MKDVRLETGRNLLFFLYNGWLEEGVDLMGLLNLADKYDIQVLAAKEVKGFSSFCTTVGWRREQISWEEDPAPYPDLDPSITKQKSKKNLDSYCFVTSF
jgi:hypothetical protein